MSNRLFARCGILFAAALLSFQVGCADDPSPSSCTNKNACGGCGVLPQTLGTSCGSCGQWVCDTNDINKNSVSCQENTPNACGGCAILDASRVVGAPCGTCGTWACNGTDDIVCNDTGANACGGCTPLTNQKGATCGSCGKYVCQGENQLVCEDPGKNNCGGCTELEGQPGTDCGNCGKWVCDGQDKVKCDDPGTNACGGCGALNTLPELKGAKPGDACGDCGSVKCVEINNGMTMVCDDVGKNECGGCTPLSAKVGTQCGKLGSGSCSIWSCDGTDKLKCGSNDANECGGCGPLQGGFKPGDVCQGEHECCTYVCDDKGGLDIDDHPANSCGGCEPLEHEAGEPCDDGNGKWTCDPNDQNVITCECDNVNVCGGCFPYSHNIGDTCKYCDNKYDGWFSCIGKELLCSDGYDDGVTAMALSGEEDDMGSYSDRDDNVYEIEDFLIDYMDVDVFQMHVLDQYWGVLTPEVWIEDAPGYLRLCMYVLEDKNPANPSYTCKGTSTAKDSTTGKKMSVSAHEDATLDVVDGKVATGFCTTVEERGTLFLQMSGFSSVLGNNDMTVYVKVEANKEFGGGCDQNKYKIKYRF